MIPGHILKYTPRFVREGHHASPTISTDEALNFLSFWRIYSVLLESMLCMICKIYITEYYKFDLSSGIAEDLLGHLIVLRKLVLWSYKL